MLLFRPVITTIWGGRTRSPFYIDSAGYRYAGTNQAINDHMVQLSYARRVTGRLAFQVAAGPEFTRFDTPILVSGSSSAQTSQLEWSLSTSLTYQLARATGLGLSYSCMA